jgi:hypothetical protein
MQRAVLERIAGGKNVVFATGGDRSPAFSAQSGNPLDF